MADEVVWYACVTEVWDDVDLQRGDESEVEILLCFLFVERERFGGGTVS